MQNRTPKDRNFEPGEFEELYKLLPKIEFFFENGFTTIDAVVMDQVVQKINDHHPEFELKLDSFHSRGKPHAVFTVIHKQYSDIALNEIKRDYENRIKVIEAKRDTLMECFLEAIQKPNTFIQKFEIGDKYDIKESQVGALGYKPHAHDMNFQQIWNQASSSVDLKKIAEELSQLLPAIKIKANTAYQFESIAEIIKARNSAKSGNGAKMLEHLKKAGKWVLSVAENVGIEVTVSVIKSYLGMK